MGVSPFGKVEKQQRHFKPLPLFSPHTLNDHSAATDTLILVCLRVRQAHLHANFRPLGQKRIGHERDALGTQMEDFVENGSLADASVLQLRVKHA